MHCADCGTKYSDGFCPNCHEEAFILETQGDYIDYVSPEFQTKAIGARGRCCASATPAKGHSVVRNHTLRHTSARRSVCLQARGPHPSEIEPDGYDQTSRTRRNADRKGRQGGRTVSGPPLLTSRRQRGECDVRREGGAEPAIADGAAGGQRRRSRRHGGIMMLLKSEIEDFCLRLERDFPGAPAAGTLQHFYTLFRERDEQSAIIGRLRDALLQVRAELVEYHDIVDVGPANEHPSQGPNWAMRITNSIDEILQANNLAKGNG